ncbi:MAG: hypothetical protein WD065_14025 [Planctomycetaceae bacterium]
MRSGTHSFLTMLFTVVPLLAVPALAIFGIPQFAPMSASPHSEQEERMLLEEDPDESDELLNEIDPWSNDEKSARSTDHNRRRRPNDERRNVNDRSRSTEFAFDETAPTAMLGDAADDVEYPLTQEFDDEGQESPLTEVDDFIAEPFDEAEPDSRETTAEPRSPRQRNWKSAVRELNRLGIEDYRLEPGSRKETFLFRCVSSSDGTPRVVRQFEAEADEPLDAVADVIRQARDHLRAPAGN